MDRFNNSNIPAEHDQSHNPGQVPNNYITIEQLLSTFDDDFYPQIKYASTSDHEYGAGPSFTNTPYGTDSNNISQPSLPLDSESESIDLHNFWTGTFSGTDCQPWEAPGYGTDQTAGSYLGSLPDDIDTIDTFGSFDIGQRQPIPSLVTQPLDHYNTLPVTTDYNLYDPSYVASGSSDGLIGYLLDAEGSITKFFVRHFTFGLLRTIENIYLQASDTNFMCLGMIWMDRSGIWPLYFNASIIRVF